MYPEKKEKKIVLIVNRQFLLLMDNNYNKLIYGIGQKALLEALIFEVFHYIWLLDIFIFSIIFYITVQNLVGTSIYPYYFSYQK